MMLCEHGHDHALCVDCIPKDFSLLEKGRRLEAIYVRCAHQPDASHDGCKVCGMSGQLMRVFESGIDRQNAIQKAMRDAAICPYLQAAAARQQMGRSESPFTRRTREAAESREKDLEEKLKETTAKLVEATRLYNEAQDRIEDLEDELEDERSEEGQAYDLESLAEELFLTDPEVVAFVKAQLDIPPDFRARTPEEWGHDFGPKLMAGLERAYELAQEVNLVARCHPFDPSRITLPEPNPKHPREYGWLLRAEERAAAMLALFSPSSSPVTFESVHKILKTLYPIPGGTLFGIEKTTDETRLAGVRLVSREELLADFPKVKP